MKTSRSHVSVEDAVLQFVKEVVPWQFAKVPLSPQLSLQGDLGIDSMGKISVAFRLEEEFGVDLSGHIGRLGEIRTVAEIVAFVQGLIEGQA